MSKFLRLNLLKNQDFDGLVEELGKDGIVVQFCVFGLEEEQNPEILNLPDMLEIKSVQALASSHALVIFNYQIIDKGRSRAISNFGITGNHFFYNYEKNFWDTNQFEAISQDDFLGDYPVWEKSGDNGGVLKCEREEFLYAYFNPPYNANQEKAHKTYNRLTKFLFNNY